MTTLPTSLNVHYLARQTEVADRKVKDLCVAYAAGRASNSEDKAARVERDTLQDAYRTAVRQNMERTEDGRAELAAEAAVFGI